MTERGSDFTNHGELIKAQEHHWFAGKNLGVLIYKINRQPLGNYLDTIGFPEDAFEHLKSILLCPHDFQTGRRFLRNWRIGNKRYDDKHKTLVARIGWSRANEALANIWNETEQEWAEANISAEVSAVVPFVFESKGRYLGVLQHKNIDERTVAKVFIDLLNQGERDLPVPTTLWDVIPVGNTVKFKDWLDSVDRLASIKFVFKRPNPTPLKKYQALNDRLELHNAAEIVDELKENDPLIGLNKTALETDPTSSAFIAAAMDAYGFVRARGFSNGKPKEYDQRTNTLREQIGNAKGDWDGIFDDIFEAIKRAIRKRFEEE